jgi:excisionase family DNA binding protein
MTTTQPARIDDGARSSGHLGERDRLVLTIAEAAEVLGISRAFAYELATRGELPVIRLGRRRLVPRKALLAMLGEDMVPPPSERQPVVPASLYRLVPEPVSGR